MLIDRTSWWWQKGRAFLVIFAALLLAGWISAPLQDDAWAEVRSRQPELKLPDLGDNLSQGMILGLFGGYRSIIADFVWLRGYTAWENRDWAETESLFTLGATLDPMNAYFWDDAGSKIAFDIPIWRIRALGLGATPQAQVAIYQDEANRALALLDRGLQFHPQNIKLLVDKAQIYQTKLFYLPEASDQYRLASTAAYFSPSMYARLSVRMLQKISGLMDDQAPGMTMKLKDANAVFGFVFHTLRDHYDDDAYNYLRQVYAHLPPATPVADKASDWEVLRELEDDLKLPPEQRLPDSDAPAAGWKPGDDPNGP